MSSSSNAGTLGTLTKREEVRIMISRVYVGVFHAPPPSKWGKKFKHGGLVANIRNMLKIPVGSTRIVRETMLATWNSLKNNGDGAIDLSRKPRFVGPSAWKIPEGSKYEDMVCDLLSPLGPLSTL